MTDRHPRSFGETRWTFRTNSNSRKSTLTSDLRPLRDSEALRGRVRACEGVLEIWKRYNFRDFDTHKISGLKDFRSKNETRRLSAGHLYIYPSTKEHQSERVCKSSVCILAPLRKEFGDWRLSRALRELGQLITKRSKVQAR